MADKHHVFNIGLVKKLINDLPFTEQTRLEKRANPVLRTYVCTVYKRSDVDAIRRLVRQANSKIKKAGVHSGYKVEVKGRLGANSRYAHNYVRDVTYNDGRTKRDWTKTSRISLDHAERFDVYLYFKSYEEEREFIDK